MTFVWPEAASEVQLIVPRSYHQHHRCGKKSLGKDSEDDGSSALCHVEYCSQSGAGGNSASDGGWLKVVTSDESRTVLDVLCVDDVIGASIEFAMTTTYTATATATATTKADPSDPANATKGTLDPQASSNSKGKGGGNKEDLMLELVQPHSSATNAPPSETLQDTQANATLHIYCYPKVSNELSVLQKIGLRSKPCPRVPDRTVLLDPNESTARNASAPWPRMAAHRAFVLAPVEDLGQIQALVRAINQLARSSATATAAAPRKERYLVLVNPISGKGHAERDARRTVVPMLEQAGIECDVVVTRHRGHAHEICRASSSSLDDVTGIVVVAGDGVFHEVVNALVDAHSLHKYRLGMVPCGTGSGLAASMAHYGAEECSVVSSTYTIWYVLVQ
jgi:Diacylglycerol kinase catalytic domain